MTGFQTVINRQPALGIEGDWASSNPRSSLVAFDGALTAGVNILVGRFAWADGDGVVNYGGNGRLGFVQVAQPSLIPFNPAAGGVGIAQSTMQVAQGYEMNLMAGGDLLCRFAAGAVPNQKVYANFVDGTAVAAATGAPAGATSTTFSITAGTSGFTASIAAGGILNVTAVGSGTLYPGQVISGSGSISGNQIIRQLSGTTGGIGIYELAEDDGTIVGSEAFTGAHGLLTLGGTVTGVFNIGDTLSGTGVTAGTSIWSNASNGASLTGAGGAGTYVVSPSQAASTGTVTAATNVETSWFVETFANAGELAIISKR
jgi:hypothetical protein